MQHTSLTPDNPAALPLERVMLCAVATLIEQRDADTHHHLLRMQAYVAQLAYALRSNGAWADLITPAFVRQLQDSVWVYDMGTLAVPERVLLNPGVYTAAERRAMQAHTLRGLAALQQAEAALPCKDPGLQVAKEVTLSHHEQWDGQGYPQGLQGATIPPAARIFALADAYDAMCSAKVYKPALSHEQAVAHIGEERGVQFDPDVVDAFMACAPAMQAIRQRYADTEKDMRDKIEFMLDAVAEPPLP